MAKFDTTRSPEAQKEALLRMEAKSLQEEFQPILKEMERSPVNIENAPASIPNKNKAEGDPLHTLDSSQFRSEVGDIKDTRDAVIEIKKGLFGWKRKLKKGGKVPILVALEGPPLGDKEKENFIREWIKAGGTEKGALGVIAAGDTKLESRGWKIQNDDDETEVELRQQYDAETITRFLPKKGKDRTIIYHTKLKAEIPTTSISYSTGHGTDRISRIVNYGPDGKRVNESFDTYRKSKDGQSRFYSYRYTKSYDKGISLTSETLERRMPKEVRFISKKAGQKSIFKKEIETEEGIDRETVEV